MRIAYLVPFYPSLFQTYILNEMTEVQKLGHGLVVVPLYAASSRAEHLERIDRLQAVPVLPPALFSLQVAALALLCALSRPRLILRTLASLHRAARLNVFSHLGIIAVTPKALATAWRLRGLKVDRIHAHFATHTAACAGIAAQVSGIPFSFTAHAHDIYCTSLKLRNNTLGWKMHQADSVVAVSAHAAAFLHHKFPEAADRIHTVHAGIPLDVFRRKEPQPRGATLRLLSICHFGKKKGLDTLIQACGLLRDQGLPFHLQLYGNGPLHDALARQIVGMRLTDRITLGGLVPQSEAARQMENCHCFVMPCRRDSSGNMDGIPTVFAEAMAMGRPVISCPVAGIPELVIDNENGLLVPPDDPDALAASITRLANDDALRIRLGRQARVIVERQHDQSINARLLIETFNTVA